MSKLKDLKGKKPVFVTGSTTINHKIRLQGRITCSEYVMLVYLDAREKRREAIVPSHCFSLTGFGDAEQKLLIEALEKKGFLLPFAVNIPYRVLTNKWSDLFKGLELEFEKFWYIEYEGEDGKLRRKTAWPDSKKAAFKVFSQVRKQYLFNDLMMQRDFYFEFLKYVNLNGFDRQKMGAAVWLNPLNEKFAINWREQMETERKKYEATFGKAPKEALAPLSEEELNKGYAK